MKYAVCDMCGKNVTGEDAGSAEYNEDKHQGRGRVEVSIWAFGNLDVGSIHLDLCAQCGKRVADTVVDLIPDSAVGAEVA